jgi:hypothetical protein
MSKYEMKLELRFAQFLKEKRKERVVVIRTQILGIVTRRECPLGVW